MGEIFRDVLVRPSCPLLLNDEIYSTGVQLASVAKAVMSPLMNQIIANGANLTSGFDANPSENRRFQVCILTWWLVRIFKRGIPMPWGFFVRSLPRVNWFFFCKRARGWSPDLQQAMRDCRCHRSFAVGDPLQTHPESLGFFESTCYHGILRWWFSLKGTLKK